MKNLFKKSLQARMLGIFILPFLKPWQGLVHDFVGRPLDRSQRDSLELAQIEPIEVIVEALIQSPFGVEYIGGDECAGFVSLVLEELSQRLKSLGNENPAVVPDAVKERQRPCHDRCVGWQRERCLGEASLEPDPMLGKAINCWCFDVRASIACQMVGPRRVQCDQDQIELVITSELGKSRLLKEELVSDAKNHCSDCKEGDCQSALFHDGAILAHNRGPHQECLTLARSQNQRRWAHHRATPDLSGS